MSRYDVNAANFGRQVTFRIQANTTGGANADASTGIFGMLQGRSPQYPHYGKVTGTPTPTQLLSQLRTSYVTRVLTAYAPVVAVRLGTDSVPTGTGSALFVTFETDESGVFFNNAWPANPTGVAKHIVTDIVDQLGTAGSTLGAKTKNGINSLLATLSTVTFDGGVTGPFGTLAGNGDTLVLPDGQTVVLSTGGAAPSLDNAGGVANNASGLEAFYVEAF